MDNKIKYIIKDGEQRSRYIIGLYFPSILKIIEPELQQENKGVYPIPLKCRTVQFVFNDEKRLKRVFEELIYDRYELTLQEPLCYIVQEIPMYCSLNPNEYVQERVYRGVHLVGGQYYDKWVNDEGEEKTCEWFVCEGEDESIAKEFAGLHRCTKGEIVQVVKDDHLTVGIVIDYCNDGSYDMWIWNGNQECIIERVPSSRVLYAGFKNISFKTESISNEIVEALKKKLL